jgi:hypothetical protein
MACQTVNTKTIQFGGNANPAKIESSSNLPMAISTFHELMSKEIVTAAAVLQIN